MGQVVGDVRFAWKALPHRAPDELAMVWMT